jgi:hypothetical protein
LEELRDLIDLVTSNLVVEGKKLTITMKSPFQELSDRWFLTSGAPIHDTHRIKHTTFVESNKSVTYSEENTSAVIGPPLSRERLKQLLDLIIDVVSTLPDEPNDIGYDL